MAVASPARTVALRLLSRQRRRGARARDLLRGAHEMSSLGSKGRALATRLVLGVNVAAGELDHRIDAHVMHAGKLEPLVRDAFRLAAFEVLYLDTPTQVSVSQGVELVRSVQPRAARMANAVLRRIGEGRAQVDDAREVVAAVAAGAKREPSEEELCLASGYPSWIVRRLVGTLGPRAAASVCAGALEPAPVYVSVPLFGGEEVVARMEAEGLEPVEAGLPRAWRIGQAGALGSSGLVRACAVVTADLAAQAVCRMASVASGRLLEVGQGRGTKSLLLVGDAAELSGKSGTLEVHGCDSIASKVRVSRERMRVAGLPTTVSCTEFDATKLGNDEEIPAELSGSFDAVLVDAPCSGSGTMRRHPEIPWSLDEAALDVANEGSLPRLQLSLLEAAAGRVAPGGSLVYATCSLFDEENVGVVDAFLASDAGRGFRRENVLEAPGVASLDDRARLVVSSWVSERGDFQSVPIEGSFDGHYCCRLVRRV